MLYRFELWGKRLWHTWEKECATEDAVAHAQQVAREYARDDHYQGTVIVVTTGDETNVAVIPVPKECRDGLAAGR